MSILYPVYNKGEFGGGVEEPIDYNYNSLYLWEIYQWCRSLIRGEYR